MKEHLKHFFPFLNKEFRRLEESELQSELVFIELFPNEDIELWKLRTIFCYQKIDNIIPDTSFNLKPKPKRNAKV